FCAAPPSPSAYTVPLHDALPICCTFLTLQPRPVPGTGRGSGGQLAEDGLVRRPHVHDLARLELQGLRGLARELGREPLAVVAHRSEEHTPELQSREKLVCRLLLE